MNFNQLDVQRNTKQRKPRKTPAKRSQTPANQKSKDEMKPKTKQVRKRKNAREKLDEFFDKRA